MVPANKEILAYKEETKESQQYHLGDSSAMLGIYICIYGDS